MLRVCLVDDDALLLAGMNRTLRRADPAISLTIATGGAEALALLESQEIDLLISDLNMPGMDGHELLAQVQSRFPHITRVLTTGALDPYRAFDLQLVAHRVIEKPMSSALLMALLRELGELYAAMHLAADQTNAAGVPWAAAAAQRLRLARHTEITADVARNNPWLAVLLLQAAHGGFAPVGEPLDMQSAVRALGTARLEIMLERLRTLPPASESAWLATSPQTAAPADAACSCSAFITLTREIAHHFVHAVDHTDAARGALADSPTDVVSVAESAALVRAAALPMLSFELTDRDQVLRCADEAARRGIPKRIVDAVRESIESPTVGGAAAAVHVAAALLHNPDLLHEPNALGACVEQAPLACRDHWRALALASGTSCRSVA